MSNCLYVQLQKSRIVAKGIDKSIELILFVRFLYIRCCSINSADVARRGEIIRYRMIARIDKILLLGFFSSRFHARSFAIPQFTLFFYKHHHLYKHRLHQLRQKIRQHLSTTPSLISLSYSILYIALLELKLVE